MTGHVRRRGERSWELKFDLGRIRVPVNAKSAITALKALSVKHRPN